jgi:hypothetical protein
MSARVSLRAIRKAERGARVASEYRRSRVVAPLPEDTPKHVRHCHALGARDWWLYIWKKSDAARNGSVIRAPYLCGSWRCTSCRKHEAHVTFRRLEQAFKPLPPAGNCFLVLTLDRDGTYSGERPFETSKQAYKALSRLSGEFLKRLRKWFKAQGWAPLGNRWAATVEMHRTGWPHVNFILNSPELADWIDSERCDRLDDGMTPYEASLVSRELADIVTGSGWGLISTAERSKSTDTVISYIVKLAGECEQAIGELSKLSQVPTNAPFRFRRLRSGKGFLPPREKNANMTGTLLRRRYWDGYLEVEPLHDVKDPVRADMSSHCAALEEDVWQSELETKQRCAKQVKQYGPAAYELPPVTYWLGKTRLERGPSLAKGKPRNERTTTTTGPPFPVRLAYTGTDT